MNPRNGYLCKNLSGKNPFEFIYDHFCEEAAFLWQQRHQATSSPKYHLSDLTELDARLSAQLKGLQLAEEKSWNIALEAWQEFSVPGEWFVLVCQYLYLLDRFSELPNYEWLMVHIRMKMEQYDQKLTLDKKIAMQYAVQWSYEDQAHKQVWSLIQWLEASNNQAHQLLALELIVKTGSTIGYCRW